ncbi:hypothetical protein [Fluviispira multicolorata]|uniref:Uncharacterized protein n=1 Tax=Fluviispira multicolorata TaxID=2654512 RepID=A0A833N4X9_9BACT|nr:hypothetical protein [Fluviispira multicolorata]KAB8029168.1 hypothetical protein GCL57_11570 [Fluviispira multicolorata]
MKEQTYKKIKNFHRINNINELFQKDLSANLFEDNTIIKIQENIYNYKKKELERLRKLEMLTQLLKRIEEKSLHLKYTFK